MGRGQYCSSFLSSATPYCEFCAHLSKQLDGRGDSRLFLCHTHCLVLVLSRWVLTRCLVLLTDDEHPVLPIQDIRQCTEVWSAESVVKLLPGQGPRLRRILTESRSPFCHQPEARRLLIVLDVPSPQKYIWDAPLGAHLSRMAQCR